MSDAAPDVHSHKCRDCGHKWSHPKARNVTDTEYEALHTCICGRVEYYHYLEIMDRMDPAKLKRILELRDEIDVFFGRGHD